MKIQVKSKVSQNNDASFLEMFANICNETKKQIKSCNKKNNTSYM